MTELEQLRDELATELARLKALSPRAGVRGGGAVGEGSWSVYAETLQSRLDAEMDAHAATKADLQGQVHQAQDQLRAVKGDWLRATALARDREMEIVRLTAERDHYRNTLDAFEVPEEVAELDAWRIRAENAEAVLSLAKSDTRGEDAIDLIKAENAWFRMAQGVRDAEDQLTLDRYKAEVVRLANILRDLRAWVTVRPAFDAVTYWLNKREGK